MHLLLGLVNKGYIKKPNFRSLSSVERDFFSELRKKNTEIVGYVIGIIDNKNVSVILASYKVKIETENGTETTIIDECKAAEVMRYYSRTVKKLGCKSIWEVHQKGLSALFYSELGSLLHRNMGIIYHEKVYCFTSNLELLGNFLGCNSLNANKLIMAVNQSNIINVERLCMYYEGRHKSYLEMRLTDYQGFKVENYENFTETIYFERVTLVNKFVSEIYYEFLNSNLPNDF
jgi:hypothetical protein